MKITQFIIFASLLFISISVINAQELKHGLSTFATIEPNGDVRINGITKGRFQQNGDVIIDGYIYVRISSDGSIRKNGAIVGQVHSNGDVTVNGRLTGKIEKNGTVRENGSIIGSAKGVKKEWAAVVFFFSVF